MSEPGGLEWFNGLPSEQARAALLACCAAPGWAGPVADGRPYPSLAALIERSDAVTGRLDSAGLRAALDGHPRIGDRAGAGHGDRGWSRGEQAGVAGADEAVRRGLAEGNAAYERRFGHVYLVCAAGRSGAELLAVLQDRLGNDPAAEWAVVRAELGKINALRLRKLLAQAGLHSPETRR